jgi:aminoglycoside phosphotransferase (APT) family kinase protein
VDGADRKLARVSLEDCLPPALRGATITPIAAGLSGAGVYRVQAESTYVLKVSSEPIDAWRTKLALLQLAAGAGLAPRIVHVDEAHRAIVSAFVLDRGFPMQLGDPRTRASAIVQLGQTLRRVHELPLPPGATSRDARTLLGEVAASLGNVPAFVGDAIRDRLAEPVPDSDRAIVVSHNDVNPTNLVHDGERLLLLDWDAAGPNEPLYDLATISVFFRFDDEACLALLSAHDGAPVTTLPPRFAYDRRSVAVTCGAMFLRLARELGHRGGDETRDGAPSLADVYQRLRAGQLDIAGGAGRWALGLALVKASDAA